jgi:2-polyprenyl-6-methoxyphenol hydroxylase-like FAD-dependent oxidoreductase
MGSAIVIGAGPAGLAMGMMLTEAGVDVIVLEKDEAPVPTSTDGAWEWLRPGVAQFRQSHGLLSRGLQILRSRLPQVVGHLERLGAHPFTMTDSPPQSMTGWIQEAEDDRFASLAASRPVYELAFAIAAREEASVDVRRGVKVIGLTAGAEAIPGVPHITGVVTAGGEAIRADVVIDASGRRSPLPALLEDIGARKPPESDGDFRFAYYTRYYRKTGAALPQPYVLSQYLSGSITIGTFPADNDTWSVTIYGTNTNKALRRVRDPEAFNRVVRAHPERAHFIDAKPISEVLTMAGVADRERRLHADGEPVATGWLPVADAWACTNPILGRGITMGLMHALGLAPTITQNLDRPIDLADAWESITGDELRPWYQATVEIDRARSKEMDAIRTGRISRHGEQMSPDEAAFLAATLTDPAVFRGRLEVAMLQATADEVMARPDIQERVAATAADMPDIPPPEIPSQAELETLLVT